MILSKTLKLLILTFIVFYCISAVKSAKKDYECVDIKEVDEVLHPTPTTTVKPNRDYKGRPRPNQKSLLIIFDGTSSMKTDLEQLLGAAKKIVDKLSSREDNPIYNYVLSIFRDPG